jgi:signal transduction histidine kinase
MGNSGRLRLEILAGFGLVALALWALIALLVYRAHSEAIETAAAAGRNIVRALAEYEESSIRTIDVALRGLREYWMRDPRSFDRAVGRYEGDLRKEKVIQVAIVDADGWIQYSRLPLRGPLNFADRDYFQEQKAAGRDQLHISAPVMGRVTRQWAIQITRPLFDAENRFAGVIVVAVPPPGLEAVFKDLQIGRDGSITLARADGTILAHSGGLEKAAEVSLAGSPGLAPGEPASGKYRSRGRVDGVERLFSYRRLQDYRLTVYVGQSMDAALAPFYRQRDFLLAGGGIASILLLAVALLLIGRERERARFLDERERLMLELHDGCIQSIYAIGLSLENSRRLMEQDPARAAGSIADAGANLNLVIQDLRAFIGAERAEPYTEQEFMTQIERLLPPPGAEGPRFSVDIDRRLIRDLSAREASHVLRIAGEAVSNIVRHAQARSGRVSLQRRGNAVCLEVSDDGVGIAQGADSAGLGLHHIQARAVRLRGKASVRAAPNQGTRIAVEFPHRA